jgi:hypothetical protein
MSLQVDCVRMNQIGRTQKPLTWSIWIFLYFENIVLSWRELTREFDNCKNSRLDKQTLHENLVPSNVLNKQIT